MMRRLLPVALAALLASPVLAQQRQADFRWQGVVTAGGEVSLHNINGDITVVPSTTGRVEVLGIKRGNSAYFDRIKVDVQPTSRGIIVCVLLDPEDSYCDSRGYHSDSRNNRGGDRDWNNLSINLQVSIPSNLEVSANSVSGDVEITGAGGDVRASTVSGDVRLDKLHPRSINANTVSGDVVVRVDEFIGRGDLKFNTVSGDVTLEVPKGFDADLSMSSVSGKVDSDFQLVISGSRMTRGGVDGRIGNGGRRLDLNTVSGDLRIRSIN
jgi:hypothetical protein